MKEAAGLAKERHFTVEAGLEQAEHKYATLNGRKDSMHQMKRAEKRGSMKVGRKVLGNDVSPVTLTIIHDGNGARWFLDEVTVTCDDETVTFPLYSWLPEQEGSGPSTRTLTAGTAVDYEVSVKTANAKKAGTDSNVFLTLYGQHGSTVDRGLEKSREGGNKFERGRTDVFDMKSRDLGALTKAVVRHDGSGFGSDWKLESVTVTECTSKAKYVFLCDDWLTSSKPLQELELCTRQVDEYKLDVRTGDCKNAGTDAGISVVLGGPEGESIAKALMETTDGSSGKFDRGHVDSFVLRLLSVGVPSTLTVEHDGNGARWFLDEVTVTCDDRSTLDEIADKAAEATQQRLAAERTLERAENEYNDLKRKKLAAYRPIRSVAEDVDAAVKDAATRAKEQLFEAESMLDGAERDYAALKLKREAVPWPSWPLSGGAAESVEAKGKVKPKPTVDISLQGSAEEFEHKQMRGKFLQALQSSLGLSSNPFSILAVSAGSVVITLQADHADPIEGKAALQRVRAAEFATADGTVLLCCMVFMLRS